MAGKKKQPNSPRPAAPALSGAEAKAKIVELRTEAEKQFLAKAYNKALESYEQAIKMADASEKGELQLKAASLYLQEKRFKDAVKATTAVLDSTPSNAAALKTRAKAYESLGFLKQALSDVQSVNKGEGASEESKDMEKRLRDAMSTNKAKLASAGAGAGGSAGVRAAESAAQQQRNSFPYMVTVKASLEDETRVLHASLLVTYAELLDAVKAKFPHAGPFVLKHADREGELVTITSRQDVQSCIAELVAQYQKQVQGGGPKLNNQLPPLRLKVVKVASEAEVPKPPADESLLSKDGKKDEVQPAQQQFEVDEWLVQFSRMFTEVTGIDPAAHQEHLALGHDKIYKAVDASLSDPKAQPLFDKAAEHFKDAACTSFVQWGNVHIIRADRQAQALLKAGQPVEGKALDAMLKEYDESEKKFNEALRIKPDSWEANGSLGQLEWERAKAKIGYVLPAPSAEDAGKDDAAAKEEAAASVKAALGKIDPKKVGNVQKHLDNVNKWFDKALNFAKAADEKKRKEEEASAGEGAEAKAVELTPEQKLQSPPGNMLVMHGNIIYEWSQVLAAVSKPWKPVLDTAVEKFRTAGAAEADVRSALKNHSMVHELDLGPDPEPEVKPEAKKEEKPKAPEAKGLPSLEVKKKAAA